METDQQQAAGSPSSRKPWPIIIAVLALTGVAIWLVPGKDEKKSVDIPLPVSQPAAPETSKATASEPAPFGDGEAARNMITAAKTDGTSLDQLVTSAKQFQAEGKVSDAYLLLFYAGRKGNAEASLLLGKQADPAYFSSGASPLDQPDMEQAHKWYLTAAEAGNPKARELLNALRDQAESLAAEGDQQAQRLILQWK